LRDQPFDSALDYSDHSTLRQGNVSSPEQHKSLARRFGELHVHPVLPSLAEQGHPEIVVLESNETTPFVADYWHSDVTFERRPPLGSVLRAAIVPDRGGDTMWSSMYAAYEALSDAMQRLLSELRAAPRGFRQPDRAPAHGTGHDLCRRTVLISPISRPWVART